MESKIILEVSIKIICHVILILYLLGLVRPPFWSFISFHTPASLHPLLAVAIKIHNYAILFFLTKLSFHASSVLCRADCQMRHYRKQRLIILQSVFTFYSQQRLLFTGSQYQLHENRFDSSKNCSGTPCHDFNMRCIYNNVLHG